MGWSSNTPVPESLGSLSAWRSSNEQRFGRPPLDSYILLTAKQWRFPKIGVLPNNESFLNRIFHEINHPAIGFFPGIPSSCLDEVSVAVAVASAAAAAAGDGLVCGHLAAIFHGKIHGNVHYQWRLWWENSIYHPMNIWRFPKLWGYPDPSHG